MKRITPATTFITIITICAFILVAGDDECTNCYGANAMALKTLVSSIVIIGGSIYFTKKYKETEKIIFDIENQPIIETDEATDGVPFSGEGTIASDTTLTSPYTNTPCVYYHSIYEELVSSGKSSHWKIVSNTIKFVPFYITDERGKLLVDITNFDLDLSKKSIPSRYISKTGQIHSEIDSAPVMIDNLKVLIKKKKFFSFNNSRQRKSEYVLRPNTNVYVFGLVKDIKGTLTVQEDKDYPLIISTKSQKDYIQQFYKGASLIYFVHLFVVVGYILFVLSLQYLLHLTNPASPLLIIGGSSIILGSLIFTMYNRIIRLKNRALNSLSSIDVELKRRHTLIPQLTTVVKAAGAHEQRIHLLITKLRTNSTYGNHIQNTTPQAGPLLTLLQEDYPDLNTADNFQQLMQSMVDTEERISYSREFYNRSVRKYNTLINQFPFILISELFSMHEMSFLNFTEARSSEVTIEPDAFE